MMHHILAIGISKHQQPFVNNLSFAAKDASDFYNLFLANVGDIGYKSLLIDSEATLSQIRTALGVQLRNAMQPEDVFFFFYSGHGSTAEDKDKRSLAHYLLPFDATRDIESSCISVRDLKEVFDGLPTKNNFIFIDTCFSGSIHLAKGYSIHFKKTPKGVKTFTNTVMGNGSLIFTACKDDEEAIEDPENKNGLFSFFLLSELQKRTSKFSIAEIITPLMESVSMRARDKFGHVQTPTLQTYLEGAVYLPPFRKPIVVAPQTIEVPKYPQLAQASFPAPEIRLDDKQLEKVFNEMMNLILNGRGAGSQEVNDILFERFCQKL
ncbi:MAG: caspase family protein, partial [Candidatus Zixiibacteriota bacterium]